jgi:hypothetical protein
VRKTDGGLGEILPAAVFFARKQAGGALRNL